MFHVTKRILSVLFLGSAVACWMIGSVGYVYLSDEARRLPAKVTLDSTMMREGIHILDYQGNRLGDDVVIPEHDDSIPKAVENSFLAAEDQDFWHHHGVDYAAFFRAVFYDVTHRHQRPLGASTITQQLIKNRVTGNERSVHRKLDEMILALRLEEQMPKQEILNTYLNTVYFGYGAYGITQAAHVYFNKSVSDLTVSDSALLASLLKGPRNYDPVRHPKAALERRHYVLGRLLANHWITSQGYDVAENAVLPTPVMAHHETNETYFTQQARHEAGSIRSDTDMSVYTSLDPVVQTVTDDALRRGLEAYERCHGVSRDGQRIQGAVVVMDVSTGRILALSGGYRYKDSPFNRVTQSFRQIGSTFKPFIFMAGLEQGYTPISPVLDTPITIQQGNGAPLWTPGADGGHGLGLITVEKALEQSRNLASVRVLYDLGLPDVEKMAQRFGVYDHIENDSAALGAQETSVLRLTSAYAMIANGGHAVYPGTIDRIVSHGVVVWTRPNNETTLVSPLSAAQMTVMLHDVVKRGTAAHALGSLPYALAGKTGTSNGMMDAWFVGYTPQIAIGVHLGYDIPQTLGEHEFGGVAAAPIFGDIITHLPDAYHHGDFLVPDGYHHQMMDPVTGNPVKKGGDDMLVEDNQGQGPEQENAYQEVDGDTQD